MTEEITRTAGMIAGEINLIKEQVRNTALSASVEIGRRLQEARGLVPEGEWTQWLERSVDYSVRTAQNLMALAAEFDAGQGKAFSALSYTKAVLLLGVPREEREAFAREHDLEAMSTRELQKEIQALKAEKTEMQITMEQLIREKEDSPAEEMQKRIDALEEKLRETRAAVNTARDVNKAAKETEKALREELKAANERLEQAMKDAETPRIKQETPPDVEKEMASLRAQATRSKAEEALRASYDLVRSMYNRLVENMELLNRTEPEQAERYRLAFVRGLRLMAEELEGRKGAAA